VIGPSSTPVCRRSSLIINQCPGPGGILAGAAWRGVQLRRGPGPGAGGPLTGRAQARVTGPSPSHGTSIMIRLKCLSAGEPVWPGLRPAVAVTVAPPLRVGHGDVTVTVRHPLTGSRPGGVRATGNPTHLESQLGTPSRRDSGWDPEPRPSESAAAPPPRQTPPAGWPLPPPYPATAGPKFGFNGAVRVGRSSRTHGSWDRPIRPGPAGRRAACGHESPAGRGVESAQASSWRLDPGLPQHRRVSTLGSPELCIRVRAGGRAS
jgi:hypothetical protein